MATNRKRRTIIEEVLPPTTDQEPGSGEDIADMIIVMSKVYKVNGVSKSFCTQTNEPVDEVFLQSNYPAGGKYIVEEYNNMNVLVNKQHYEIEPKALAPTNGNGNGHGVSATDVQIRMLFEELNFTRQMLMQQLTNNNNKGGSLTEMIAALAGLHQLAPGGKDPVELLIKGMELGMNGGSPKSGDWKTMLIDTVKEVAPGAIQAIAMANSKQPMNGNEVPMLPVSPDAQIKMGLDWIKSRIIAGMDTDLAVGWITTNANDPQYQPLIVKAIQSGIDGFIAIDHEIANEPYRSWFDKAITEIKEWYEQQQQVQTDDDMDGGNGNGPDVRTNAGSRDTGAKLTKTV